MADVAKPQNQKVNLIELLEQSIKFIDKQISDLDEKKKELEHVLNLEKNSMHQKPNNIFTDNSASKTYFDGKKGCFDESCLVIVHGKNRQQNKTKISNVKRGDVVTVVDENQLIEKAVVQYVVKIAYDNNYESMVKFEDYGLMVTEKHPVRIENKWRSPKDFVNGIDVIKCKSTTNYVYNLVLDRVQVALLVNDMECVTFGHYFEEAWHDFYATSKVVKTVAELATKQNNENGLVVI